ncbi:MAG: hypothetical protein JRG76_16385, partial [Deltaproteobacteria bacterium]|nr:hypothetical protein [Deltaproteobacteria bacterium]
MRLPTQLTRIPLLLLALHVVQPSAAHASPIGLLGISAEECTAPEGEIGLTGVPVHTLCDLIQLSALDQPIDAQMGPGARTGAGDFNNKLYVQLLAAAKGALSDFTVETGDPNDPLVTTGSAVLNQKLRDGQFLRSSPLENARTVKDPDTGLSVKSSVEEMLAQRLRALNGQIGRATSGYARPTVFGDDPNGASDAVSTPEELQSLKNQRDNLLYRPRDRSIVNRATGEISDEPLPAGLANLDNAVLDLFVVDSQLGLNDAGGAYDYQTFDSYEELNLLAPRPDPDRSGVLADPPVAVEGVEPWDAGVARDFNLICVTCLEGVSGISKDDLGDDAVPNFLGLDAISDTRDDLPVLDASIGRGLYEVSDPREYGGIWRVEQNYLRDPDDPGSEQIPLPRYQRLAAVTGLEDDRKTVRDKEKDGLGSRDLVLFAVLHPSLLQANGCINQLGGAYLDNDTPGGSTDDTCVDRATQSTQIASLEEAFVRGCWTETRSRGFGVGLNAEGDCVELNIFRGSWSSQRGVDEQVDDNPDDIGVHPDLVPFLAFGGFRPAGAAQSPEDLTDLLNYAQSGRTLPARPRLSSLPSPHRIARLVDPDTGAPVASDGTTCQYRTRAADGTIGMTPDVNHPTIVGPDGLRETDQDNLVASAGDCLLFTRVTGGDPNAPWIDELRSNDEVADLHAVDQQRFHRLCTAGFDDDAGSCGLDHFNNRGRFQLVSQTLAGVGLLKDVLPAGLESIRLKQQPLVQSLPKLLASDRVFWPVTPPDRTAQTAFNLALYFEQGGTSDDPRPEVAALLGCGPAYMLPCGSWGLNEGNQVPGTKDVTGGAGFLSGRSRDGTEQDRSALDLFGPDVSNQRIAGGIDLMSADASVVFQESTLLKASTPFAPVGTEDLGAGPQTLPGITPDDDVIEPMPWELDPDELARGVILYQVANQYLKDPRCDADQPGRDEDGTGFGDPDDPDSDFAYCQRRSFNRWFNASTGLVDQVIVLNDPTDDTNPATVIASGGENCTAFVQTNRPEGDTFDEGCTQLERFSANLERYSITLET